MKHLEIFEYPATMETQTYLWTTYWEGIMRENEEREVGTSKSSLGRKNFSSHK